MTRLDRVASVKARIGWKALTASEYVDDGYVFLATPNIKGPQIDFENVNYINRYRYEESPELQLAVGDVLLAKDGSTLGIVNTVRHLPRPSTVNGSIAVLRPTDVDSRFLAYWLQGSLIQARIQQVKDGMGVPHLFQADIRKFPVPETGPHEQRRVADFLDDRVARIDQIIAARRAQMQLLDAAAKSQLAASALSGQDLMPLRYLILDERLGLWGQDAGVDEMDVKVARVADFHRPEFRLGEVTTVRSAPASQVQARLLRHGDVLLERSGGTQRNPVGCPVFVDSPSSRTVSSNFVSRLRPAENVDGRYLSLIMGALYATRQQEPHSNQTTGIQNLNTASYFRNEVPQRSLGEQKALGEAMDATLTETRQRQASLTESIDTLVEYKQSLITAAVSGELDVSTAGSGIPG